MQELARSEIEAAFGEMGELLARRRKLAEVAVYGGAAILLQFDVTFRTGDVDAVVESGDHGAVMQAAKEIAERRGWLASWFSEAVANYTSDVGGMTFHGSYPAGAKPGLRVYAAKPDYILAMKLRAMRIGSRDEADAGMLARATGLVTFEAMTALLGRYFPKEPPDDRRLAVVRQFAEALHAAPSEEPG